MRQRICQVRFSRLMSEVGQNERVKKYLIFFKKPLEIFFDFFYNLRLTYTLYCVTLDKEQHKILWFYWQDYPKIRRLSLKSKTL